MKRRRAFGEGRWPYFALGAAAGAAAGVFVAGNFFTEGKKVRKKITASYGVGDDAFVRSMSHLLGPPLTDGNSVTGLQNGAEIFPAMLEAIGAAQRTICFENFIFWSGRITARFAEALAGRARAGVRVHLLQDAFGCNGHNCAEMELMRAAGVEIELYRSTHFTRINQRTHRKLLIIDGRIGFTGGVGIGDLWDGHGDKPDEWRDSHYRLEGPAVAQMQHAFMDNWLQTHAELLHGDDYFPSLEPVGTQRCQVFKSSSEEGSDSARIMVLLSIAAARESVRIANAYFIPGKLLLDTVLDALERGVRVEIIVPGPYVDQPGVRLLSRSLWGPLLDAGARIYEFMPTNFHCKYMIVDDCWTSVGSTNLDHRSLRLNEEANLNVLDAEFAREQARVFEADKAQSHEITAAEWRQRSILEKLGACALTPFRLQM